MLARAKDTSRGRLEDAGILVSRAGKVRLLTRERAADDWDPRRDRRLTVWEATHHLVRRLEIEGESAAADLLRRLGGLGETARELAYRLYTISRAEGLGAGGARLQRPRRRWPEIARRVAGTPAAEAQQSAGDLAMADTNNERVGQGAGAARQGLAPFVDRECGRTSWASTGRTPSTARAPPSKTDVAVSAAGDDGDVARGLRADARAGWSGTTSPS